jgi:hypothetical protein
MITPDSANIRGKKKPDVVRITRNCLKLCVLLALL